ncbi:MAG: ATP-binding cassette domain-containing protein [Candidatus Marsarchaeota archaeon]|nr:ATP-binding cassette domain-containing protein [Candidatus Marsarchaeota archaeon]
MSDATYTSGEPVLSIDRVSVEYTVKTGFLGSSSFKLKALDEVSLDVKDGEVVTVIGESGSGKTTLGLASMGLVNTTSGSVRFKGLSLGDLKGAQLKRVRSKMRIVFQDPYSSLDPRMKISDIVAEPLRALGETPESRVQELVSESLESVGLNSNASGRYPHEFSGGQRQRIAIARAIVGEPEFVVLDEPTSSLDVSIQGQTLNLLLELQKKRRLSYLFITHSMSVAKYVSDRLAVMYAGRIVETGPVQQVIEHPLHPYTVDLIRSVPGFDIARKVFDAVPEQTAGARAVQGCQYAPRCRFTREECRLHEPGLSGDSSHLSACFLNHHFIRAATQAPR